MDFNTKLLHGKAVGNYAQGATLPPISQVSAFTYESAEQLEKVCNNRAPGQRSKSRQQEFFLIRFVSASESRILKI